MMGETYEMTIERKEEKKPEPKPEPIAVAEVHEPGPP